MHVVTNKQFNITIQDLFFKKSEAALPKHVQIKHVPNWAHVWRLGLCLGPKHLFYSVFSAITENKLLLNLYCIRNHQSPKTIDVIKLGMLGKKAIQI